MNDIPDLSSLLNDSASVLPADTFCGMIGIFGAPNAGKSTLLNRLTGEKVVITSPKPQTTRRRVRGIVTKDNHQLIFVDTPGIFQARSGKDLEQYIVRNALDVTEECDANLLLIDAGKGIDEAAETAIEALKRSRVPLYVVLTKTDTVKDKTRLLEQANHITHTLSCKEIFMISARKGDGITSLVESMRTLASPGPFLFPEDAAADTTLAFDLAEITRECIFFLLREELPYGMSVMTEQAAPAEEDGVLTVYQTIYCLRASHKAILLGKQGTMIKRIGEESRKRAKDRIDGPLRLFLHVKVKPEWQRAPERYGS